MRDIKKYAENYVKDAGKSFEDIMIKYRRKKVLELLENYPHKKILEIGCGLEPLFKFLDSNFYDEYMVIEPSKDFYENAINLAKNNNKIICRNEFFTANNDLKNKGFDFIIISSLLHEIERPNEFIAEVKKICKQNTIVHINVPNANSFHRLLAKAMGLIKDTTDFSERNVIYQQHSVFDLNSLENLVKSAGFDVMEKGSYFIKPFSHKQMYDIIRNNIINEKVLEGLYMLNDITNLRGGGYRLGDLCEYSNSIDGDFKKKIVIIVANTAWNNKRYLPEPFASVPILTAILKEQFELSLVDANGHNYSKEETFKAVKNTNADMALIATLSVEWHRCYHDAAKIAKDALGAITLMGGVYPTVSGDFALKDNNIDFIMLGCAEERIDRIIKKIFGNDNSIFKEPGIGYRNDDSIIINPIHSYIGDVKKMVKPDYSLQEMELYLSEERPPNAFVKREASIISSYGCPFNCVFCATRTISGTKTAYRPVDDILEEIEYLINNYHIDSVRFLDDNILTDRKRAEKLFTEMIKRKYNIKFQLMNSAAWLYDEDLLSLMKEAGCYATCVSLESGCNRVLKDIMHKPLKKETVPKTISLCHKYGLYVAMHIVIGLPGETWDEILETIKYAEDCNSDFLQINIATVFPKTELYEIAKNINALPKNFSFYADDTYYGFAHGHITTDEFSPEELKVIRTYEWDRINFTDPEKRRKLCEFKGLTEKELSVARREARRSLGESYLTHRKEDK